MNLLLSKGGISELTTTIDVNISLLLPFIDTPTRKWREVLPVGPIYSLPHRQLTHISRRKSKSYTRYTQ